ncbi:hypothetical protein [Companilactobacillus mishanensis]|nr:hypothetical protein [Companilactobacillus mishanensis]
MENELKKPNQNILDSVKEVEDDLSGKIRLPSANNIEALNKILNGN